MKLILRLFSVVHAFTAGLFAIAALTLIVIAGRLGMQSMLGAMDKGTALEMIEVMGLLAAAVVALQIAQTITEEEVVRGTHVSGPTRVRRFLSRFFVVVTVALSIEGLVATFKAVREDLSLLLYPATLLVSAAALLAAWGVFIRLNRFAEEIEPEAMQEAKREDRKLK